MDNMEKKIHGFTPSELTEVYNFLCVYECKQWSRKSGQNFEQEYPQLKRLEELVDSLITYYYSWETMQIAAIVPMDNLLSMTRSRDTKVLSFLYHLRNSIAHGQIEKEDGFIYVWDYTFRRQNGNIEKLFSARGKINSSVFFEIMNVINENVVLS